MSYQDTPSTPYQPQDPAAAPYPTPAPPAQPPPTAGSSDTRPGPSRPALGTGHDPAPFDPLPDDPFARPPASSRVGLAIAAGALAIAAVTAAALWFATRTPAQTTPTTTETTLQTAKQECAAGSNDVRLGDNGHSMVIERVAAEEDPGASLTTLACIIDAVGVPDAVVSQMDSTRALDGRQHATWDGFTASWTYHPDDGLNIILQDTD